MEASVRKNECEEAEAVPHRARGVEGGDDGVLPLLVVRSLVVNRVVEAETTRGHTTCVYETFTNTTVVSATSRNRVIGAETNRIGVCANGRSIQ